MKKLLILTVVAALTAFSPDAVAETIDLTAANNSGDLAGTTGGTALFYQGATLSGTGVFPSFVQVRANGAQQTTEDGYNTTVNNVNDNGESNTFNHEIQVQDLTIVNIGGTDYYEFLLDINENNSAAGDQFLSLDEIVVLTSTTANQSTEELPAGITRWDMNDAADVILLDYALETGSGRADMRFYVKVSDFAGALDSDYVYLYSAFGGEGVKVNGVGGWTYPSGNYAISDGFEEWAYQTRLVSVPDGGATALLLGLSMLGMGVVRRFRR